MAPKAFKAGPLTPIVDRHIERIQSLADRKASEMDKHIYDKYNPLVEQVVAFLRKRKVLIYGGTAINLLLPPRLRFYKQYSLPDIDILCVDAEALADDVIRYFNKKGLRFGKSVEALHPGTWKVFIEGMPVLDVSKVSPEVFARLAKGGVSTSIGLRTANPEFLRMTLHILLSQPKDSWRWSKMLRRVFAFYQQFPPHTNGCAAKLAKAAVPLTVDEAAMVKSAETWVRDSTTGVLSGIPVFARILKDAGNNIGIFPNGPWRLPFGPALDVIIDESPLVAANRLSKHLKAMAMAAPVALRVEDTSMLMSNDFMPRRAALWHGTTHLVTFTKAPGCLSYVDVDGHRLASMQTVVRMAMNHQFVEHLSADQEAIYACESNMLVAISMNHLNARSKKLLQSFVIQCYGTQPGMATLQRDRIRRKVND